MLHDIFMFCSIMCIFISTNLGLHWRHVQKCLQNIRRNCREPRQITEILIINFDERYMFYIELKIHLFLMQPLCQILKKLYVKSTPCNNLRRRSYLTTFLRHVGVNRNTKLHQKYSLTFDYLHQNALQGILVPQ